jgi:cyclase
MLTLKREDLDPQLRLVLGGGGNSLVLLHEGEAFVTDAKFGDFARRLRGFVERDLGRKVRRLMLTHAHYDHAGGAAVFSEVGAVLVHPNARARLDSESLRLLPYVEVEEEIQLALGREPVRIIHPGVGHTNGDLVAFFPARKLLVAGDLILNGYEPYPDASYGGDMLEFVATMGRLMALDFERVLPGHGAMMNRSEVERWNAFFVELERQVRAARAAGMGEDACVEQVKLPEWSYQPIPFSSSREKSVRAMWRALESRK